MHPSRQHLFHGKLCIFQQDNVKPQTASIPAAWLCSRRVWELDWPDCSPDLSHQLKIFCASLNTAKKTLTRTGEQLQVRHNIPLQNVQQLVTSVPRSWQNVKRRGDASNTCCGNVWPIPLTKSSILLTAGSVPPIGLKAHQSSQRC